MGVEASDVSGGWSAGRPDPPRRQSARGAQELTGPWIADALIEAQKEIFSRSPQRTRREQGSSPREGVQTMAREPGASSKAVAAIFCASRVDGDSPPTRRDSG
jgi:hypothetical protein